MESENLEILDSKGQLETLDTEVKRFADKLPYWAKYLANKILTGVSISETEIDTAYSYLLEELKIIPTSEKSPISISQTTGQIENYKLDNLFVKLDNVEGVNALIEKQTIEFTPNLTIIYGANGSGKSGYVRLLKQAFYSKAPEEIIKNIHIDAGHKPVSAQFSFKSAGTINLLKYPDSSQDIAFNQFAVFDGKSILRHLEQRNEFEFRPAGLSFFSDFTETVKIIETKLNTEITTKQTPNDFPDLFDGESEIKSIIQTLNEKSEISELKKYLPYNDEDKAQRKELEKNYDELLLASKGKENEIKSLENIKLLLLDNKRKIETLNSYFTQNKLLQIKELINDFLSKDEIARAEGVQNFKTDKIQGIGTNEWKSFIVSAQQFALKQKKEGDLYPLKDDNCLFCHQHLSIDAQELIHKYWTFIKSIAEENAKTANDLINRIKADYEKLNFDLFPIDNTLTNWYYDNYPEPLAMIELRQYEQIHLAQKIISNLNSKSSGIFEPIKISTFYNDEIIKMVDSKIKVLQSDKQSEELAKLLKAKTKLAHKEKLEFHIEKLELYIKNRQWISKANSISWISVKRNITESEKVLSNRYFNQKYIDAFNHECITLKGNFGISIDSRGSGGKSNRQLLIKGNSPSAILSEGEQKVIALADFLAEMKMSEINRGLIFDDPVNSLDEIRKGEIAVRLVDEALSKQIIIFTHDLVFVSSLIGACEELKVLFDCHWIEKLDDKPGTVWLKNTPSFEKLYKKSGKAQEYYNEAKKVGPEQREDKIKNGFAALRTSYESLVVFDLFKGVVQRFNERVSVDSLSSVSFTSEIRDELLDSFYQCCRYMEGHLHSDKYAYKKPTLENLNEEIQRFNEIKKKI